MFFKKQQIKDIKKPNLLLLLFFVKKFVAWKIVRAAYLMWYTHKRLIKSQ